MASIARRLFQRLGLSHGVALFGAAFMVVIVVALRGHLADMRREQIEDRLEETRSFAHSIDSFVARSFDTAAMTLRRVHDHIEFNPAAERAHDPEFRQTLSGLAKEMPYIGGILIINAEGAVRHSAPGGIDPGIRFADTEQFLSHRAGARGVLVGGAIRSRVDGSWIIPASLGCFDADGAFVGIVLLWIPVAHFTGRFETILGYGIDAVGMFHADGRLLARAPAREDLLGRSFADTPLFREHVPTGPSGDLMRQAATDGIERLTSWRTQPNWPVVITVGIDSDRLYAAWQRASFRYVAAAIGICLVIAALILLLIRQLERRQAAERHVRSAIDNVTEAFALFDAQDRLVLCTMAYVRMYTDRERPEDVIGLAFEDIVRMSLAKGEKPDPGLDGERWIAERIRRHRDPPARPHVERLAGDRWVQVSERRLPDGGIVGVRTDITPIKQREKQLEDARRDAELANRAKSRFLAAMSHELRTPLNAILGFSEIVRDLRFGRGAVERYAAYAADIHRSGEHLLDLINDLLDMSKIEAGRYSLNERPLDVGAEIGEAIAMLRERARAGGIVLATDFAEPLPLLHADERALRQVLLNLLSNAVKFTPSGGRVWVSLAVEKDGTLALAVHDTGIGIAKAAAKRLFQPFAQADSALVRQHEGSGLGLAISRALIELHGGTITLESEEGHGTSVQVRFPRERVIARVPIAAPRRVAVG